MTRYELVARARQFRREPTRSERLLWAALRGRSLGVRFYRQQVIWPFIADLVAERPRLIVEIDGRVHEGQVERDQERQEYLEAQGYRVVRFSADDVERRGNDVVTSLARVLDELREGDRSPGRYLRGVGRRKPEDYSPTGVTPPGFPEPSRDQQ